MKKNFCERPELSCESLRAPFVLPVMQKLSVEYVYKPFYLATW